MNDYSVDRPSLIAWSAIWFSCGGFWLLVSYSLWRLA